MATITTRFSVGDRVFCAGTERVKRQLPCPDCLGRKKWSVTSPAGADYEFACPRCSSRYSDHDALRLDYWTHVGTTAVRTIASVEHHSNHFGEGPRTRYMCGETGAPSGQIYDEQDLHETELEAWASAEARAAKLNEAPTPVGAVTPASKHIEVCDYQLSDARYEAERSKVSGLRWSVGDLLNDLEADETTLPAAARELITNFRERESV